MYSYLKFYPTLNGHNNTLFAVVRVHDIVGLDVAEFVAVKMKRHLRDMVAVVPPLRTLNIHLHEKRVIVKVQMWSNHHTG